MKTYLLFFGKSQDFTTHVFDNNQYIENFDKVIKDFDLLESKTFTVDGIDNKEMLSKYNFKAKDGKKYSLLKLYSFAQAFSGDRISGSIYGVALLSEGNISISKSNLNILNLTKSNFAKLCLNNLKFESSDFYEEANKIWKAVVNHKDGNYLDKIDFANSNISNTNLDTKGFYVNNLFDDASDLNKQMNSASRIYISEDLAHLKRAHDKWGNNFKIYAKTKNGYDIYSEPKPIEPSKPPLSSDDAIQSTPILKAKIQEAKIADLEEQNNQLYEQQLLIKKKNNRIVIQLGVLASLLLVTTISFFFTSNFFSDKKNDPEVNIIGTSLEEPEVVSINKINLDSILDNSASIDSLIAFSEEVKYINSFDVKVNTKDSSKFSKKFKSIQFRSDFLKIDISKLEEIYNTKKNKLKSISFANKRNKIKNKSSQLDTILKNDNIKK